MDSIDNKQRRVWLKQAMSACGLLMTPAAVWAASKAVNPKTVAPWLSRVCDRVIPDTNVPGAVAAGVPAFLHTAVAHGLSGATASLLSRFEQLLTAQIAGDVMTLDDAPLSEALGALDEAAFGHPRGQVMPEIYAAWKTLKSLIVLGYFTSEIGATEALDYVLVPGRFEPDVPLSEHPRAFSSDWTGVKYG
ncbi:MAG: gluconate 2-dehydrogenase subunit 3 family protein [Gammaproteobacteria bacterium]|nr:gluconate 2-dehydrogenase subunit 3 family protein [Gammaproteobacteria bacterium]